MVQYNPRHLDAVFRALGDATRRAMVHQLAGGARRIGELAEPHAMSFAAASKHVRVLEAAGLVTREIRGRTHICHLAPGPLASAHAWIGFYQRFWIDRLDILEDLLRGEQAPTPKGETP